MVRRHGFHLTLALFAATALWSAAQQAPDDLETPRLRLQAIRKNQEEYARLRENWNAFQKLSEKRQEAVKKLDMDLHALTPTKRERYTKALDRYVDWLDRLKKSDPNVYRAIAAAPDAATRLALIKDQRDREWMETQPKAYREQWTKLQGDARTKFVADRRQEERTRHQHWLVSSRFWKELETKQVLPARLADFAYKKGKKDKADGGKSKDLVEINPVKDYFDHYLAPSLSVADKKALEDAEGRWPDYPMALVAAAGKHPTALPPAKLPTTFDELPKPVQDRFDKKTGGTAKTVKLKNEIKRFEKSPSFASKFAEIAAAQKVVFGRQPEGNEYMAAYFKSLTPPMQAFVSKELAPAMKNQPADERKLTNSEGQWPEYPKMIQELSAKYHLRPPWHILPDADKFHWDRYRPEKIDMPEPEKGKDKEAD
jgi:hypothetical protein